MNHHVKTEKFQGPISLLYEMIESKKLSVSEFSLVQITEDFINYVKSLGNENFVDKEEMTHFISIASILILLKSKTLIPELELTEEEDRDIQILENQLQAFAVLKERVKYLEKLWSKKILLNAKVQHKSEGKIFVPSPQMDTQFFHKYILERLQELVPKEDEKKEVKVHKTLKIEDALSHVRTIIKRIKSLNFKNLNTSGDERLREKNKRNIVILFLAVLELVKIGEIDVVQEENFSDILISGE
jgi:segregation and condensation protein A